MHFLKSSRLESTVSALKIFFHGDQSWNLSEGGSTYFENFEIFQTLN